MPCPGHNAPTSFINILKGLTEGGRLCSLLWGLYIADLVTTLQRSFPEWPKTTVKKLVAHMRAIGGPGIFLRGPDITLPPPELAYFITILLYVDDFALPTSSRAQLLALVQLTLVRKQPVV